MMQLLGVISPALARMQHKGEIGQQKKTQYNRYLTVVICFIQGWLLVMALANYAHRLFDGRNAHQSGHIIIRNGVPFVITSIIFVITGTLILV
jgi:preprotein translocase subunit SecY